MITKKMSKYEIRYKELKSFKASKKVLMAFLNLFKDWVFLIEPGRSFHNLGAAAAISNFVKVLLDNSSFWKPTIPHWRMF